MKFLLLLLVPVLSFAHVGESAKYELTVSNAVAEVEMKIENFDRSQDQFKVVMTTKVDGQSTVETALVNAESIMTHDKAKQILDNCEAIGGTQERVGSLQTCKVVTDAGDSLNEMFIPAAVKNITKAFSTQTVWIGDVSIHGIVKLKTQEGYIFNVKSYTFTN